MDERDLSNLEFAEVCIHHLANRELKYPTFLSHRQKKWHAKCSFPVSVRGSKKSLAQVL